MITGVIGLYVPSIVFCIMTRIVPHYIWLLHSLFNGWICIPLYFSCSNYIIASMIPISTIPIAASIMASVIPLNVCPVGAHLNAEMTDLCMARIVAYIMSRIISLYMARFV
jgi:hypothetical protein